MGIQLLKAFKCSIQLPGKRAMFQLNRMKMGGTLLYLFILLFIVTIPGGVRFILSSDSGIGHNVPPTLFVLQYIVFDYLLFVFTGLCTISFVAAICLGISGFMQRKMAYRHLWKLAAYATTVPFLLYAIAIIFNVHSPIIPIVLLLLTLAILTRMISIFPKLSR